MKDQVTLTKDQVEHIALLLKTVCAEFHPLMDSGVIVKQSVKTILHYLDLRSDAEKYWESISNKEDFYTEAIKLGLTPGHVGKKFNDGSRILWSVASNKWGYMDNDSQKLIT